jgi:hypothetical protein
MESQHICSGKPFQMLMSFSVPGHLKAACQNHMLWAAIASKTSAGKPALSEWVPCQATRQFFHGTCIQSSDPAIPFRSPYDPCETLESFTSSRFPHLIEVPKGTGGNPKCQHLKGQKTLCKWAKGRSLAHRTESVAEERIHT